MLTFKHSCWIVLIALTATVFVYANGLNGPFLFDDHIHISQNQWVKIESLSWDNLVRAWNSSFSAFPASRPLAQLSFGVNHALTGLDPWAFKATNLAIHLANGVLVFIFSRLAYRAVSRGSVDLRRENLLAMSVAVLWLLHPLHVSTVLYTVQRMAQLSSLSLLAALTVYFWGRLQLAQGMPGRGWIIAAAPIAMIGFLGKENTVLLPILLLVSEITLLRRVSVGNKRGFMRGIWVVFIALPLIAGLAYVYTHPSLINGYQGRPFTLDERLLTQPRILWFYLRLLFVPDVSAFGLFHDDIAISTDMLSPPSTILAILGLAALLATAFLFRRIAPVFAFSALFFLANHVLESTALPLEMVFEHRNYLASLGPLFLLAYLITIVSVRFDVNRMALLLGVMLILSYTAVTFIRANNWSSYTSFILASAENHPTSPRSNFMAGQMLISALASSDGNAPELANAARTFLQQGIAVDPRCINCMFGLLILDLNMGKDPDAAAINRLTQALRSGHVGPTKVSIGQFSYLVRWQRGDGKKLPADYMEEIFEGALSNPNWNNTGRAGIEAAYREYWEHVAQDLPKALEHGQAAVRSWPSQWSYHLSVAKLLQKLRRMDEALTVLDKAASLADNQAKQTETAEVRAGIERDSGK